MVKCNPWVCCGVYCFIVLAVVGGIVGIFYAVINGFLNGLTEALLHRPSTMNNMDLLLQMDNGTLLGLRTSDYYKPFVVRNVHNLKTFASYKSETIYYATTEKNSSIISTSEKYPNLTRAMQLSKKAMAVDYLTEKLYVLGDVATQVTVMDLNNNYSSVILKNDQYTAEDIRLHPVKALMFILTKSAILQASMDGTDLKKVVESENIRAMAIDKSNDIIYFATPNSLESYHLNGTRGPRIDNIINIITLDVESLSQEAHLYYVTDWCKNCLHVCALKNYKCKLFSTTHSFKKVQIYDREWFWESSSCDIFNGLCEQLCVLTTEVSTEGLNRKCFCSEGWILNEDGVSCKKVI